MGFVSWFLACFIDLSPISWVCMLFWIRFLCGFDFRHIKAIVFHIYLIPKGWNTYRKHETQTKPNPALPWWYISPIPWVCSYLFILVFIDMSPISWVCMLFLIRLIFVI